MAIGFIYLLSNPAMPGQVKIGYTLGSPDDRADDLSGHTGFPQRFVVEYWCLTNEPEIVEKTIHERLGDCRVSANREFFATSPTEAIRIIDESVKAAPTRYVRPGTPESNALARGSRCGKPLPGLFCWSCG